MSQVCLTDDETALSHVMAWHQVGHKPYPKAMVLTTTDIISIVNFPLQLDSPSNHRGPYGNHR